MKQSLSASLDILASSELTLTPGNLPPTPQERIFQIDPTERGPLLDGVLQLIDLTHEVAGHSLDARAWCQGLEQKIGRDAEK